MKLGRGWMGGCGLESTITVYRLYGVLYQMVQWDSGGVEWSGVERHRGGVGWGEGRGRIGEL